MTDAYPYRAGVRRLSREGGLVLALADSPQAEMRVRCGLLLATRLGVEREGVDKQHLPLAIARQILRALRDPDPAVAMAALHWISDDRLQAFAADVKLVQMDPGVTADVFYGAVTTLARLETENPGEGDLVNRLKILLQDEGVKEAQKKLILSIMPDAGKNVKMADLLPIFRKGKPVFQAWLAHYIGLLGTEEAAKTLRALVFDEVHPAEVRAAALLHIVPGAADEAGLLNMLGSESRELKRAVAASLQGVLLGFEERKVLSATTDAVLRAKANRAMGEPYFSRERPELKDVDGWLSFLEKVPGKPDIEHGREVFLSPRLGGCAVCHRVDGLGSGAGPELTHIGAIAEVRAIVESLLQPNANVSPQYESYSITLKDAEPKVVFELSERGGNHQYIDLAGNILDVKIEDLVKRERLPVSIMPEGLVMRLTDAEVRDLVVFLASQ
ncbi:MAG: c-type cytochrome, partial [Verrucomicrobiales bacterium]|nr:c-type cytochrome [Verrucomicrobiales bacterium]